jgi:prevent-host-death family protein
MTSVGIRELRQRAIQLLRQVERGETIEITDRGRPVAVLAPFPDRGPTERLRAAGDFAPAGASTGALPPLLEPGKGKPTPSEILAGLRGGER